MKMHLNPFTGFCQYNQNHWGAGYGQPGMVLNQSPSNTMESAMEKLKTTTAPGMRLVTPHGMMDVVEETAERLEAYIGMTVKMMSQTSSGLTHYPRASGGRQISPFITVSPVISVLLTGTAAHMAGLGEKFISTIHVLNKCFKNEFNIDPEWVVEAADMVRRTTGSTVSPDGVFVAEFAVSKMNSFANIPDRLPVDRICLSLSISELTVLGGMPAFLEIPISAIEASFCRSSDYKKTWQEPTQGPSN